MNIIKIYLNKNASGSVAELYKDFALFVNSYQNKLIDVYVPKSMLYSNDDNTFSNAVKIGALLTADNGSTITSDSYYLNYLKDATINNVEYSVYERILPKEFTVYPGNVTITTNVLSIDNTDASNPVMLQVITTQTCNLLVQNSAYLGDETVVEPTKTEQIESNITQAQANIVDLQGRMTDAETQIDLNTGNIATNTEDIAKLQAEIEVSETYIGQMTGSSLPTTTQLDNFVNSAVSREPKNGDVIIFIQTIAGGTDKNYKYIYSVATGWNYYELPPMEQAYNGSLGLVKGSYNVGITRNVLVDINAGEFTNIYVKNVTTSNYLTLDTFLNNLYNEQQGIKNGTVAVGLATKAVKDENDNNIASTYMTNNAGATKQYVQEYALPKEFFKTYFIDADGYTDEPPTEPVSGVQFTKETSAVGEFNIFNISRTNASLMKLTNKNSAETTIYVSANQNTTFQLKLTNYVQKQGENAQNLSIELSNEITLTAGDIYKVDFQSNFNELSGVLNIESGDIVGQILAVVTQELTTTTYSIISNDVYPSSQTMNTQSLVVITQQGNLGEIPVYDLNGTITGTQIDFDFGSNEIYANTLAKFILRVAQQTELPITYTLNLIYDSQNVRIATPYNYQSGNATIQNIKQTNITFNAVNGTVIEFLGFINIDEGDNITVIVNEDDLSDAIELFKCTYGTTTYAQITSALNANKIPYVIYSNILYTYKGKQNDTYFFNSLISNTSFNCYVDNNDNWSNGFSNMQNVDKLVTSISASSSNTQYPSAKCVYDQLQLKQGNLTQTQLNAVNSGIDSTKVTQISTNATNISNLQTNKQDIFQYSTMPTASASNSGQIVQYVGTTDANYINGYFYKSDGSVWNRVDVQPNSGGGGGSGSSLEVLWENSSPTNAFTAQTITLINNDCDYFIIQAKVDTVNDEICDSCMIKNGDAGMINLLAGQTGLQAGSMYFNNRLITASTQNSITFSGSWSPTHGADNNHSIPLRVLGIKL